MCEPFNFKDGRNNVEELKAHQLVLGYTVFRAIKENKDICSMKDFYDFFKDVENDYNNLKDFHQL